MHFIDTHAHLTDPRFQEDYLAVVERARTAGVTTIINVAYDVPSSRAVVALAEQTKDFYAAIGIHPHDAKTASEAAWQELRKLATRNKVVAVGEIGLDYYYNHSSVAEQASALRSQVRLARELSLPIIIHDRDAHEDVLTILREEKAGEVGGVMHCFSGDWDFAQRCLELGFYISLAGPVTFKKPGDLPRVAQKVPLARLLIETDSPYLAPVPCRGKRNEPAHVVHVAKMVAQLRNLELAEVAVATSLNARQLFSLDKFTTSMS
ncbi:MAG: TatD family hydrolase [Firmicutes bacterium]|nr:TatD family hydrolase [Bacillota bacterium]